MPRLTYPVIQLKLIKTKLNSIPSVRFTRDVQRVPEGGRARVFEWGCVRRTEPPECLHKATPPFAARQCRIPFL